MKPTAPSVVVKPSRACALAAGVCALLLGASSASAQFTFNIQPLTEADSKDTKIFTHSPTNTASNLNLTSFDTGEHFLSLVQFDLSVFAGRSANDIISANFSLYSTGLGPSGVPSPSGGAVTVSPILDAWKENANDAGTAQLATYDAFFATSSPSPTLHIGSVVATQSVTTAGFYSWDITTLVKAWVSGTQANNGVILQVAGTNQDIGFADVDSSPGVAGSAPALAITVPEPSVLGLGLLGLVGLGLRRRCALPS